MQKNKIPCSDAPPVWKPNYPKSPKKGTPAADYNPDQNPTNPDLNWALATCMVKSRWLHPPPVCMRFFV
ncbi:hypothetical protein MGG_17133 [Pyricularia oryzae 70-15]|uniref:Uncharacterized protein n=1 Tax=Pyricularia oryzae (strain 70-15 / ATCC MYA-4617 / FGSC 8958) TaxID=242507 RepID=G4NAC5_PYRO7|nr:uncharacterized protein MGG_17133 [Pyricularia oryzae 70-15]EHA50470.1 hypothetical protein MGG_17133 [Pyricularia oryzae 70-15]